MFFCTLLLKAGFDCSLRGEAEALLWVTAPFLLPGASQPNSGQQAPVHRCWALCTYICLP